MSDRELCASTTAARPFVYPLETLPKRGSIYTVREIVCSDEDGLRLVEIVNPALEYLAPSGSVTHERQLTDRAPGA